MPDNVMARECEQCGVTYGKRPREHIVRFQTRRFCSYRCSNISRIKPGKPHAPCIKCGGPVRRRDNESHSRFSERQCCSTKCARELNAQGASDWHAAQREEPRGWPEMTGSRLRGRPFAAFDKDPGDGGLMRLPRPVTFIETEASS
jgi:hypothetical protein